MDANLLPVDDDRIKKVSDSLMDGTQSVCTQFMVNFVQNGGPQLFAPVEPYFLQVSIDLVGDLTGRIYYCLDQKSAFQIASAMMMGMEVTALDEMSQSALMELSNMMAGSTCTKLNTFGINCDISTPKLYINSTPPRGAIEPALHCIRLHSPEGAEFLILFTLQGGSGQPS